MFASGFPWPPTGQPDSSKDARASWTAQVRGAARHVGRALVAPPRRPFACFFSSSKRGARTHPPDVSQERPKSRAQVARGRHDRLVLFGVFRRTTRAQGHGRRVSFPPELAKRDSLYEIKRRVGPVTTTKMRSASGALPSSFARSASLFSGVGRYDLLADALVADGRTLSPADAHVQCCAWATFRHW